MSVLVLIAFAIGCLVGAVICKYVGRWRKKKAANTCQHDKLLIHTVGTRRFGGDVVVAGICEACSQDVRYELGHVVEDAVIDVLDIRLRAKGYVRHPQTRGGDNVIYQRSSA